MSGIFGGLISGVSFLYTAIAGTASSTRVTGGDTVSSLTVNTDGTWQLATNGTASITLSPSTLQTWVTPNSASSGNSGWLKVTVTGDPLTTAASSSGVLIDLTSNRVYSLTALPTETWNSTLDVKVYDDSGGTHQVSTGTVTLGAIR